MKLKSIRKEELSELSAMDPFSVGSRLFLPGYFCIGAFPENETGSMPQGILIFCDSGKELIIEWLYVVPEYRECGIGEELLSGIYLLAHVKSYDQVGAVLWDTPDTRAVCPFGKEYLMDRYFEKDIPISGEWHKALKALLRSGAFLENSMESYPGVTVRTAAELTIAQKRDILRTLSEDLGAARMYPRMGDADSIDDVSILCFKDKKLCGAAIFESEGKDLYLTYFWTGQDDLVNYILPTAIMQAFRRQAMTTLHIAIRDNVYEELFGKLLGSSDEARMLVAQTEMFFADQDYEVEELPDFFEAFSTSLTQS